MLNLLLHVSPWYKLSYQKDCTLLRVTDCSYFYLQSDADHLIVSPSLFHHGNHPKHLGERSYSWRLCFLHFLISPLYPYLLHFYILHWEEKQQTLNEVRHDHSFLKVQPTTEVTNKSSIQSAANNQFKDCNIEVNHLIPLRLQ